MSLYLDGCCGSFDVLLLVRSHHQLAQRHLDLRRNQSICGWCRVVACSFMAHVPFLLSEMAPSLLQLLQYAVAVVLEDGKQKRMLV